MTETCRYGVTTEWIDNGGIDVCSMCPIPGDAPGCGPGESICMVTGQKIVVSDTSAVVDAPLTSLLRPLPNHHAALVAGLDTALRIQEEAAVGALPKEPWTTEELCGMIHALACWAEECNCKAAEGYSLQFELRDRVMAVLDEVGP